jgi:hypothetical protein
MKINFNKFKVSIILILFAFFNPVFSSESYSELAIGSKAFALGQSATISYSGILHAINNPASLALTETRDLGIFYNMPFQNSRNFSTGISIPIQNYGVLGFSYYYFLLDVNTSEDEGSLVFKQDEYVISYGLDFADNFIFGINAKWTNDEWQLSNDSDLFIDHIGFDASFGILPKFSNKWFRNIGIGIMLKNFIQFNDRDDSMPKGLRILAENRYTSSFQSIHFVINYSYYENSLLKYQGDFHLGLEYGFRFLFFRVGYFNEIYSFGSGIKLKMLDFSYGYGNYYKDEFDLPSIHNFTISIKF